MVAVLLRKRILHVEYYLPVSVNLAEPRLYDIMQMKLFRPHMENNVCFTIRNYEIMSVIAEKFRANHI